MDKPAPDRDASVKSLGIFLNNKGHLESQILYVLLREKIRTFSTIKDTYNEPTIRKFRITKNAKRIQSKKNVCI